MQQTEMANLGKRKGGNDGTPLGKKLRAGCAATCDKWNAEYDNDL